MSEQHGIARILTWNIHKGIGPDRRYDLARIIDLIAGHDPDIVALQELDSRGRGKDGGALPLETLKQVLGSHAAEARTIVAPDGHYGHVLISRWPMHLVNLHDISVSRREPRCAIEALIHSPTGLIKVIATHLGLQIAERRHQVDRLTELVHATRGGLVVLGDFNDWHGQVRRSLMHILPARTMIKTFPAWRPLFKLDRVYARPLEALLRSWTDSRARRASDHLPVIVDLKLPELRLHSEELQLTP